VSIVTSYEPESKARYRKQASL